jgi:O-methyltransferase
MAEPTPIPDATPADPSLGPEPDPLPVAVERYLEMLARCLTREAFLDQEWWDVRLDEAVLDDGRTARDALLPLLRSNDWRLVRRGGQESRAEGRDWPPTAETMIGTARLENVRRCCVDAIHRGVPGDFMETGVWRGGATILMKGVIEAFEDRTRRVWVADSFEGLPVPDERYPADDGLDWSRVGVLKVDAEAVRDNFARYGLLDDRVCLLEGWFEDTLPSAPVEELAVLRLDGDLYQSTMDALVSMEPKVVAGGYVIVDDYGGWVPCRRAVDDYRESRGITAAMHEIDWTGVWWRKD